MDKSVETIVISTCPSCGKRHAYNLNVTRSSVMFSTSDASEQSFKRTFTCPKTGGEFESTVSVKATTNSKIVAVIVQGAVDNPEPAAPTENAGQSVKAQASVLLTPQRQAIYEAGKAIFLDSVTTGREFCHSMIGITTGAIPVYFAILTFLLPKQFTLGLAGGITIALPAVGFLAAAVLFVFGYLPLSDQLSLDEDVDKIRATLDKNLDYRKRFLWSGTIVFVISTLLAIWAIVINIGVK